MVISLLRPALSVICHIEILYQNSPRGFLKSPSQLFCDKQPAFSKALGRKARRGRSPTSWHKNDLGVKAQFNH